MHCRFSPAPPRFCKYPQEIGLRFLDGAVEVAQCQILSHQHKIATRLELYIGHGADYYTAKWRRLGWVPLPRRQRGHCSLARASLPHQVPLPGQQ